MRIHVRLFARLREIAGAGELERELPGPARAEDAWDALAQEFPELAPYRPVISCAVNEQYARFTTALEDGDEVAFLPPVSGGSRVRGFGIGLRIPGSGFGFGARVEDWR